MTAPERDALRELAGLEVRPAVSLLLPTHRAGKEIRGDAIRLKTLLREAHEELGRWGLHEALADRILEPAWALLDDRPFWREGAKGRALFAAPNMASIYRQASTHPGLVAEPLTGSPDDTGSQDLAARAAALARPHLDRARERARQRVEADGPRFLASELGAVLAAAADGRVSDLFVDPDAERWGRFDRASSTLRMDPGPGPESDDLVSLAVALTLLNAGAVHAAPRSDIPGGGEIAAVLRYPSPEPST